MRKTKFDKSSQETPGLKLILFLISPLLGFLGALNKMNSRSSFVIFFLFSVLFGLCFITEDAKSDHYSLDSAAYRYRFDQYKSYTYNDLSVFFNDLLSQYNESGDRKSRDLYVVTIAFLASRISDNYHVFFAFLAAVMAFFQLLSIKFLVKEDAFKGTFICLLIAYFFIRGNGIFNINTCRFWTASWISIYCNFQIFKNGNKRFFILALITPLIHVSYWFYIIMIVLIYLTGNFIRFWKIALFASFLASSIAIQFVSDMSSYLPAILQGMVEMYINDIDTRTNLFQVLRRIFAVIEHGYIVYMMVLFMRYEQTILSDPHAKRVYQFLLVWLSVIFFFLPVPSLGKRYLLLAMPMLAYLWLIVFESRGIYRNVIRVFPFFFIFSIYEEINVYLFWSVKPEFWVTSPLYLAYKYLFVATI